MKCKNCECELIYPDEIKNGLCNLCKMRESEIQFCMWCGDKSKEMYITKIEKIENMKYDCEIKVCKRCYDLRGESNEN